VTRFTVKPIHTDGGTTRYQVRDTQKQWHTIVETFLTHAMAERACAQLNAAHAARERLRRLDAEIAAIAPDADGIVAFDVELEPRDGAAR
jgi:hypothetical protein